MRGRVLPEGDVRDVYVVGSRFTFEPPPKARTPVKDGWLLPGLVDAHAHLALNSPLNQGPIRDRVRASARAHLDAGVLLIREPGSPDRSSAGIKDDEGLPRVITAGRFLAPPDGYVPGLAREVTAEELPIAAAEEARASGAWAKVVGDFAGPEGRMVSHWDAATLKKAADAVHRAGARITMHAVHPDSITKAIDAGFDAIEHGIGLQEDHIEAMADRHVALVPTLLIGNAVPHFFEPMMSPDGLEEVVRWLKTQPKRVAEAAAAGVTVLAGTDAGMVPHGMIAIEVGLLAEAGMTAAAALGAASWDARSYFGLKGIEEGAPADLVAFDEDPRVDPKSLRRPRLTILGGSVVLRGSGSAKAGA